MKIPTNNPGTGSEFQHLTKVRIDKEKASFSITDQHFRFSVPVALRNSISMRDISLMYEAWRAQFSVDNSETSLSPQNPQ